MPCNGISTSRLTRSGAQILRGNARTVVTDGRVGAGDLLLECTRVVKGYQRLCLVDDEEDLSDMLLASTIELPSPVAVKVPDTEIDRLGRSTRELLREDCKIGIISGKSHAIGC